ncbi:MAG: DUF2520 domain-containing protein [bacterium]|nr:DUF2520 domain-containing protein [bacterium]
MKIGVIGRGSLGRELIKSLKKQRKCEVRVNDSDKNALHKSKNHSIESIIQCEQIFICVNDDSLYDVMKRLSMYEGSVVIFSASCEVKNAVRVLKNASSVSLFHPIQSFSKRSRIRAPFCSFYATLQFQGKNRFLEDFAKANNIKIIKLKKDADKKLYHLSAMLAGNYTMVLIYAAERLLKESTKDKSLSAEVFLPMIRVIIERAASEKITDSLSGPIARNDKKQLNCILKSIKDSKLKRLVKALNEEARRTNFNG